MYYNSPNYIIPLLDPLVTNKSVGAGWRNLCGSRLRQHFCSYYIDPFCCDQGVFHAGAATKFRWHTANMPGSHTVSWHTHLIIWEERPPASFLPL